MLEDDDEYSRPKKQKKETKHFHPIRITITILILPTVMFFFIYYLMPELSNNLFKIGRNTYQKRSEELSMIIQENKVRYNNSEDYISKGTTKLIKSIKENKDKLNPEAQDKREDLKIGTNAENKEAQDSVDRNKRMKSDEESMNEKLQIKNWNDKLSFDKYEQ